MVNFSLLTFNCFGGMLWNPRGRLLTLARELNRRGPDVVFLQEVKSSRVLRMLISACTAYSSNLHAPHPGTFGVGPAGSLLTLSRPPISPPRFDRFRVQGRWYTLTLMDVLTGKGALVGELEVEGIPIIVVNTHIVANYWADWRPGKRPARDQQRQLHQLADLVRGLKADAIVIVGGDFNLPRHSWLYDEFLERSGLFDPMAGDERPTYRPFPGVGAHFALPIDFVFTRIPPALSVEIEPELWFADKHPLVHGGQDYLSDHIGVGVTLSIRSTPAAQA